MKAVTLNLVNKEKSEIPYNISKFPDGQQNITLNINSFGLKEKIVTIKSRLNNWLDLELIVCSYASIRNNGCKNIKLYVAYFLGSRSDRQFESGSNNYLKQVICPIINSLNFESVSVLDPHSNCLEMGINNIIKYNNCEFVKWALIHINNKYDAQEKIIFISPDIGAIPKINDVAKYVNFQGCIVTCTKSRGIDGELTKTNVPMGALFNSNKDAVIIDDICDGGMTFINIAKELKSNGFKNKIYLIVTHGIFSKGFEELLKYFDGIYCTDSYSDLSKTYSKENESIYQFYIN